MELDTSNGSAVKTDKSKSGKSQHFKATEVEVDKEKNTQLLEQVPIEDTPFTAVKFNDQWFLTMGKYRLSEKLDSLAAVKEDARDASWIRIMQIIQIMITEHENERLTPRKIENLNTGEITHITQK